MARFRWARAAVFAAAVVLSGTACSPVPPLSSPRDRIFMERVRRGDRYRDQGVLNRAYEYYRQALPHNNYLVNIHARLGLTAFELGEAAQAFYHLRYAMKFYPEDHTAYLHTGLLLLATDREEALKYLNAARALAPDETENIRAAVAEALAAERASAARQDPAAAAAEMMPYVRRGDFERVFEFAAQSDRETRCGLLLSLARTSLDEERADAAVRLLEEAWRAGGGDDLLITMGNLHFAASRFARASALYLQHADRNPAAGIGYFNLGVVYLRNGLRARAEEMFLRAGTAFSASHAALMRQFDAGEEVSPLEPEER